MVWQQTTFFFEVSNVFLHDLSIIKSRISVQLLPDVDYKSAFQMAIGKGEKGELNLSSASENHFMKKL